MNKRIGIWGLSQSLGLLAVLILGLASVSMAQEGEAEKADSDAPKKEKSDFPSGMLSSMKLRGIGPAINSGRVGDFAVNPNNPAEYYVAVCSGGVWKTSNSGTTFKPIFDSQNSYSIGCITLDPSNPETVWVGSGENNSQRSVNWGDGVYRSKDGGKSWKNMGLKDSEHIGKVLVHPEDSNTVFVAAQGPLWKSGGERGLYRSKDGGESWQRILFISDDTGVNEVHMDPRNPNVLYASAYQRRRRVWTLINGGPESGVYKSEDGGDTWRKINKGLPGGDKGRIGLAVSPVNPDIIYSIVEAQGGGGVYRSTNRGESWSKRSSYMTSSPQYYNELVADPIDEHCFYALDTRLHTTTDGGKTMTSLSGRGRHVDDHALWIDPKNNKHLLIGCDGGIYESWDHSANWQYKPNLPITQFYKLALDNAAPFYNVYGGTQDNNTLGGPVATTRNEGIMNEDWFVTVGGDGFEPAVDPTDENIVYSQWQYGGLIRHDRRSGETLDIKPREAPGEEAARWNWDAALLISPHDHKRIYYCSQRVYRSDDRGDSWRPISGDLTRDVNRNLLEVMGKIQKVGAVSKNRSTSPYGTIIALTESPLKEGVIFIGTDDGLVQVTEDGGASWRKIDTFGDVPKHTYVNSLVASLHDVNTVYACFDNHKNSDFKPYILKSTDLGQSWHSVAGDLPDREVCYAMAEDHVDSNLLFVGTEFGAFVTVDGGSKWKKLSGLPTIAVRDIEIQRRENDLVLATFGRGFYVLDDYTALRHRKLTDGPGGVLPVKPALRYVRTSKGRGSQGASFYRAPNPSFGATFRWWIKDVPKTAKSERKKKEKKDAYYPTWEELEKEDKETASYVVLTIKDDAGAIVRRLRQSASKGVKKATWDLRYASPTSATRGGGPLALPGTYTVQVSLVTAGSTKNVGKPRSFEVVPLDLATFAAKDKKAVLDFYNRAAALSRVVSASSAVLGDTEKLMDSLKAAILGAPKASQTLLVKHERIRLALREIRKEMSGDTTLSSRSAPTPMSISARVGVASRGLGRVTSPPTQTWKDCYAQAKAQFARVYPKLKMIVEQDIPDLQNNLEKAGAAWTKGRLPEWTGK
ncbi:MAG: photosystem II stability/assembly factor-like uncharacterized protein [Planctomycetota bacterium]|jgi:photosystem II stability/assembly factor-like uncharacterized protein